MKGFTFHLTTLVPVPELHLLSVSMSEEDMSLQHLTGGGLGSQREHPSETEERRKTICTTLKEYPDPGSDNLIFTVYVNYNN